MFEIPIRIVLLIFTVILYSCSNGNISVNKEKVIPDYVKAAEEKFGTNYKLLYNEDSTYVICDQEIKSSPKFPQNRLSFFIYDINNRNKVFEETISNGMVNWENNHLVKIIKILEAGKSGRNRNNYDIVYYDIKLNKIIHSDNIKKENIN